MQVLSKRFDHIFEHDILCKYATIKHGYESTLQTIWTNLNT